MRRMARVSARSICGSFLSKKSRMAEAMLVKSVAVFTGTYSVFFVVVMEAAKGVLVSVYTLTVAVRSLVKLIRSWENFSVPRRISAEALGPMQLITISTG